MSRSKDDASRVVEMFHTYFSTSEIGSNAKLKSRRDRDGSGVVACFVMRRRTSFSLGRSNWVGTSKPCWICWSTCKYFLALDFIHREMSLLVVVKSTSGEASMS